VTAKLQHFETSSLLCQPKLAIRQVNDPLEHEADRIANQMMQVKMGSGSLPAIVRDTFQSPGQPLNAV
jgi:hypothetical protein